MELGNIVASGFAAWDITGAYNGIGDSRKAADDDRAAAIIREFLRGDIEDIRQSARSANEAVSMMQVFTGAAAAIGEKLSQMKELAEGAATGYYTDSEKADMQEQFEELAEEINSVVADTEYDDNTLFTAEGQTKSISIDNGLTAIDILAKDLSVDIDGLDLTTAAGAALAWLQSTINSFNEYSEYLGKQAGRLEVAMARIESDITAATGVDSSNFDTNVTREIADYVASKVSKDTSVLLDTQANVTPVAAAGLLEYKGRYTAIGAG